MKKSKRKSLLLLVLALLVVLGTGGWMYMTHSHAHSKQSIPPLTAKNTTLVTFPSVTSNLQGNTHYISFTVSTLVYTATLTKLGGSTTATSGTGSTLLDTRVENALTLLSRQTPYQQLQTPTGVTLFQSQIKTQLQKIFGVHSIGTVYFPSLITQ